MNRFSLISIDSGVVTEVEFKVFGDPMGAASAQEYAETVHQLQQAQVEGAFLSLSRPTDRFLPFELDFRVENWWWLFFFFLPLKRF